MLQPASKTQFSGIPPICAYQDLFAALQHAGLLVHTSQLVGVAARPSGNQRRGHCKDAQEVAQDQEATRDQEQIQAWYTPRAQGA